MLGAGGCYAPQCLKENYIGVDFNMNGDLSGKFPEKWEEFNEKYVPIFLNNNPSKSKVAAGLACGTLWRIGKKLKEGDIVLCPNGQGEYLVGSIAGEYYYVPNTELPHRRAVKWNEHTIRRNDMSANLRHCTGAIGTCVEASSYAEEIERLISASSATSTITTASAPIKKDFHERDLHCLFCTYLRREDIIGKTIFHEKSTYKDKEQRWVHPDIVGVQFMTYNADSTKDLVKSVDPQEQVKFYSYELKRRIKSDNDLKEYYFQALSNSSWAHYGYLVALEIDDSLLDELKRLNNAFGIGVIRLQAHDTEVILPARENKLDYYTIDKICKINKDFDKFIKMSTAVLKSDNNPLSFKMLMTALENGCDDILKDEEIEKYCQSKNIPY